MTEKELPQLKQELHNELLNAAKEAKSIGYNPTMFNQMLANEGGYKVAKKLILNTSSGFSKLWELGRLDLSTEAVILRKEFRPLFTAAEIEIARDRLKEFDYEIDAEIDVSLLDDTDLMNTIISDIEAEQQEDGYGLEGNVKYYYGKRYERDSKNRKLAIKKHGLNCYACGFNFEKVYGEYGKDFIEVHHIKPLSTLEEAIEINPETDLVPLCANCHRMVHRRKDNVLEVEQLKSILRGD